MRLSNRLTLTIGPAVSALLGVVAVAQAPKPTMKAIVIHEYGGPEVLKYEEAARLEPKDDEILIRVMAASINPVDAAGVVEKTGAKITKFKAGDPVYAFFTLADEGGYAEFAVAKEKEVSLKPKPLTYEQAAAVPAAGSTAWLALVDTTKLSAGQTVLIHGGSGGVGHLAIQIAKARGAKVIATASTANQEFLKQLGADVAIDYTKTKFEDVAKDVDVVLDSAGKDTLQRSYSVVRKGGIIVSIVDDPDPAALATHGIRGTTMRAAPKAEVLEQLGRLIEAKKVTPVVSQTWPLVEAAKAQEQIATHHTRGKIVLNVREGGGRN
jgi:NADPH:quinone reductase-like Zn-dependent oxidoreductase